MSTFKIGDKVRRKEMSVFWANILLAHSIKDDVFVVVSTTTDNCNDLTIRPVSRPYPLSTQFSSKNFELVSQETDFIEILKNLQISEDVFHVVKDAYDQSKAANVVDWKQISGIITQWQLIKKEFNGGIIVEGNNFQVESENNILWVKCPRGSGKSKFLMHLNETDTVMVRNRPENLRYRQEFATPRIRTLHFSEIRSECIPLLYLDEIPQSDVRNLASGITNQLFVAIGTY
jgi:hypothetical protein